MQHKTGTSHSSENGNIYTRYIGKAEHTELNFKGFEETILTSWK